MPTPAAAAAAAVEIAPAAWRRHNTTTPTTPSPIAHRPQHQQPQRQSQHTATVAWPCGRTTTSMTHHRANYDPPVTRRLSPASIARSSLCQINLRFCNSVCKTVGFMYIPMHFHDKPEGNLCHALLIVITCDPLGQVCILVYITYACIT